MSQTLMFTGDVNLMNVTDPTVPFAQVGETLRRADVLFGNLECCLFDRGGEHSLSDEGFWAPPAAGKALKLAGYHALGNANNVNYGAAAIGSSLAELDRLGIPHTGAGRNAAEARAPAIVEAGGKRVGFLQRTSVYWPTDHEAGERSPGVAALRGHTAYQLPLHKIRPEIPPANRPGIPPVIVTWADRDYLARHRADLEELRKRADIVIASQHWGLGEEVLEYMTEIAHSAIDAGADVVIGHGPHYSLPMEIYKGKPIFYGLGSFSFHTGHGGRKHGNWVGMLARVALEGREVKRASFQFVRHNDANETILTAMKDEQETLEKLRKRSAAFATKIEVEGDEGVLRVS